MSALSQCFADMAIEKAITPGGRIGDDSSLDRSPKKNWVERAGGLPKYIRMVAHAFLRKGKSMSAAIRMAVGVVRNWSRGQGNVRPKVQAAAAAAIAEWEAKKVSKVIIEKCVVPESEFVAITKRFICQHGQIKKGCGCGTSMDMTKKRKKRKIVKKAVEIADDELLSLVEEIDADMDYGDDFRVEGEIEKMDTDKQLVFGWCSIAKLADGSAVVDKQGDVLEDIDQMEKVAYDFVLHSRDGGEMHVRKGVSTLVESFMSTPEKWEAMGIPEGTLPTGWWVGFHVHDTEVWKGVKSGKYKMFSVHGSGLRKALEDA